ncbi:RidA family protein [Nocardia cyriacigeorgica]|uniref:RidA family protein n=1 Tax=Nocardia cyriacigeorgica TaxID=135487 RepID=UPI0013D27CA0|nr:RidA family protein [Nocardia cyriacigeorgica]NEW26597.1 RidA family protein [Nocardia cyriacigeorgica]
MTEYLNPGDLLYPSYGMNPGVATKDYVFAGGMALDLETLRRKPGADSIADETKIALAEIESVLAAAGCSLRDVVKTTCYLSDDSYRKEFWEAYTEVFAPGPYPARTTFVVGIAGDCRVEIDAIAVRPR